MSTALSMPSPHSHSGTGAFATSLQLSPAFRSLHAAALRQRQAEFERLRELARSDEFSDDESDGDEDDELDDNEDEEHEQEQEDDDDDDDDENDDVVAADAIPPHTEPTRLSPRDTASDSDTDETVLLPFIRPSVAGVAAMRAPHEAMSPRVDDWTIVDKSPTCEGLVFGNVHVSESWFSRP